MCDMKAVKSDSNLGVSAVVQRRRTLTGSRMMGRKSMKVTPSFGQLGLRFELGRA